MTGSFILDMLIIGAVYSLIRFLLEFIFGGKRPFDWVNKHYKNYSNVDIKKAKESAKSKEITSENFTYQEMVAVFAYILNNGTPMDALSAARLFGTQGWEKKYNYDFYAELENFALTTSRRGYRKKAKALLQFGYRLAESQHEDEWRERYFNKLSLEYSDSATLEWDRSRRLR